MLKVFWEFFAEVGDFNCDEFMEKRPTKPVVMRTWAYKGDHYLPPYTAEQWQCYVLHDYSEQRVLFGYARRNEKEDWRLSDALAKELEKKMIASELAKCDDLFQDFDFTASEKSCV